MFHTRKLPLAETIYIGELALRSFLSKHDAALHHAAALLADRRGARLFNAIRGGLAQPGPLTSRMRTMLLDLRGLLFLEHTDDEAFEWVFDLLSPEDPVVAEICLLADGFDDALRGANIFPRQDWQAA